MTNATRTLLIYQAMSKRRFPSPTRLVGIGQFSDDHLASPRRLLGQVRNLGPIWDRLEASTDYNQPEGRPRMPGSWMLAFLMHVASGRSAWQPWWRDSWEELWQECGFECRPSYPEVYLRFVELERAIPAIEQAVGELLRLARSHDPRLGIYVHYDGSDAAAHVHLEHDCSPQDDCPGFRRGPSQTNRPRRIDAGEAADLRAYDTDNTADDVLGGTTGGSAEPGNHAPSLRFDGRARIRIGDHYYRSRDPEAGMRVYTRHGRSIKFWIGYYRHSATDCRYGGTLALTFASASRNESDIHPQTLEKTVAALGRPPLACVGDRGLAMKSVFKAHNERDIASVIPLRDNRLSPAAKDGERIDRDGVVRCKYCGGECRQVRFHASPPRIWAICNMQLREGCYNTAPDGRRVPREQSVACSHDDRRLGPLSRVDPIYHELLAAHGNSERSHLDGRRRFAVAGNDLSSRLKRIGLKPQLLRGVAGMLLEWTLIAHRCGWLAPHHRREFEETNYRRHGAERLKRQTARRREAGLDLPYGPRAAALGIGPPLPPSQRPGRARGKPTA